MAESDPHVVRIRAKHARTRPLCYFREGPKRCLRANYRTIRAEMLTEEARIVFPRPTYSACVMHWWRVHRQGDPRREKCQRRFDRKEVRRRRILRTRGGHKR